jgi:hypothetical protein
MGCFPASRVIQYAVRADLDVRLALEALVDKKW